MKNIGLTLALSLLAALFVAPAVMAQQGCPHGPGVTYISHDPNECATIRFFCAVGQEPFNNECGCGCIETSMASFAAPAEPLLDTGELPLPPAIEPPASAHAADAPETLSANGVEAEAKTCPDGPEYHYITRDPRLCLIILFFCDEDQTPFFNECGCGCKDLFVTSTAS